MTEHRGRSWLPGRLPLAAIGLVALCGSAALAQEKGRLERLPEEARVWLEDEVAYIITDEERDVFLDLETVEERNAFIDVFWQRRDPVPATPENEFKEEHERRLEEADRQFQEIRSRPGRRTDRGRMYVILGKPRSVDHFDNYNELVSSELWFYEGDTSKGLPPFFYLLFYKPLDLGEYRLYNPVIDTPGALLRGKASLEPQRAVDALYRISPELARAAITFDATGPANLHDASAVMLGTEMLISRIEDSPKRAVRTDYVDGWLRYGKRVSAEYSFNYVPSRHTFAVLFGPDGTPFLQYAVELDLDNFPVETDEARTRYYTTVDVSLEIRSHDGTLVLADEKESYVELSRSQVETGSGSSFSYQDGVPLVPGTYEVSVILRNRVLHQYTVAEREVRIEGDRPGEPSLGDPILGFQIEDRSTADGASGLKTFEVDGLRVQPATNGLFAIGDTALVFLQARSFAADARVRIALLDEAGSVARQDEVAAESLVVRRVELSGLTGGNYVVRAQLVSASGGSERVLDERKAQLTLSPRTEVPRPAFTARRSFDPDEPGMLALTLGDQLWALGRYDEARARLEQAVAAGNPNLPMAQWKLAGAYVRSREPKAALALLEPLAEAYPEQYEVALGLGLSYYLMGQLESAASYLEKATTIRPPSTSLLNALGDVYRRLDRPDDARRVLQRSLELDPNQEHIKKQVAALPR